MKSAFRRIYLSLIISLLGPFLLFGVLMRRSFDADTGAHEALLMQAHAELLRHAFAESTDPPDVLLARQSEALGLPLRLWSPEELDLDPDQRAALEEGKAAVEVRTLSLSGFVRVDEGVVQLGPIRRVLLLGPERGSVMALLMLAVGMVVVVRLIRPLDQQLGELIGAAQRFGRGELQARAVRVQDDPAGDVATTFNGMADRIGRQLENQRALLHVVSHELRTPLARLRFGLALLEAARDEQERLRRTGELERDISELDALVGELLQYLRLEGGGPELKRVDLDLHSLLAEVIGAVLPLRPEVDLSLDCEAPPALRGDARLIRRAVQNLAVNAVRHADCTVSIGAALVDGAVEITVDDDGPGIPPEQRERVFEPFVRLEGSQPDARGSGLGLAIVRRIALAHDGDVKVEASALGGARMRIRLPATRPG